MDRIEALFLEPPARLAARLERMLATGRITTDEADRLRSAIDDVERREALTAIRMRHARARVDGAVAAGGMLRSEADDVLRRLALGDDPKVVRRQLRDLTDRTETDAGAPDDDPSS